MKPTNPTPMVPPLDERRAWYIVDATDRTLGRMASRIAAVLRGKHKPEFTPHWDLGDYVVVINAERVSLSGRKWAQKRYYRYTGYSGGIKERTAAEVRETHPERIIEAAVRRMLPKNRLGRKMVKKLKVYAGPDHPHVAQDPQPLDLEQS